jgi:hypothetical protein
VWIDHTGRGAVEITDCNGKLCGHVAWVKDPKDAEGCGEQIIGDVKPIGGGKWDNGWIYDPDSASKYDVELTPNGNTMRVVGYAGTKWLSETMTWKRAPADLQKCSKGTAAGAPAPKADDKAASAPAAKPAADTEVKAEAKTEAKPQAKAEAKAPETELDKQATAPESDEPEAAEPKAKTANKGKAAAKIAEALNLRKTDGGRTCKIDVPYLDAVVSFPCQD